MPKARDCSLQLCYSESGVQGASRPRKGPSPPAWFSRQLGLHELPYRPTQADSGQHTRRLVTPNRKLPVRPDLDQLKHQAKDLLRAIRRGDPSAISDLHSYHPEQIAPAIAKLADAQLVLACRLIDAIWRDDVNAAREIVLKHPQLLHEDATIRKSHWGPPMSYAANLGRDAIIAMLYDLGAKDLASALNRAALQSQIGTARRLHQMMGAPRPSAAALVDPAYTLSVSGTALMLELGSPVRDETGKPLAPVAVVLQTDGRNPSAKHQILEMYVQHGLDLPDTPVMALHRGRIDLIEEHLRRDSGLLRRTFTREEIYPPEWGCRDDVETQGTPLAGTTLLHICVDYDEIEIARWLLDRGMDVDAKAAVRADGFGGHTALFGAVVSYANFWGNYRGKLEDAPFARLLLDRGANPNALASFRKQINFGEDSTMHEYRDLTPLSWGERFPNKTLVSAPAMQMIAERGGHT